MYCFELKSGNLGGGSFHPRKNKLEDKRLNKVAQRGGKLSPLGGRGERRGISNDPITQGPKKKCVKSKKRPQ